METACRNTFFKEFHFKRKGFKGNEPEGEAESKVSFLEMQEIACVCADVKHPVLRKHANMWCRKEKRQSLDPHHRVGERRIESTAPTEG